VASWRLKLVVDALQVRRGVPFTGALTWGAELGDLSRLEHPSERMKDRGLTPSESARGERRRQGALTQSGTTPARRVQVEEAWAYRYPAKGSRPLQLRLEKQPKERQELSGKAQVRGCKRYRPLIATGQHANPVVALAREWVGCIWAMAKPVKVSPERIMRDKTPTWNR
jgi:hypothetical protein